MALLSYNRHGLTTTAMLVMLGASAMACTSAPVKPLPRYFVNPGLEEHPRYPRARYMTAMGFAASYPEAAARASAEIAMQIRAQVESDTEASQRYVSGSGESERVSVTTRVTTAWAHAELIRVVEHEERDGTSILLVAMSRAEADEALARDGAFNQQRYELAVKLALAARREGRAGDFDSAEKSAKALEREVNEIVLLRRAVLGRASPEEARYQQLRTSLEGALAEAQARRVVDVIVPGPAGNARLAGYAIRAIHESGVPHVDDKGCTARAGNGEPLLDAAELIVESHETCAQISLGEKCEIELVFNARGCASGALGKSALTVNGVHPTDEKKARNVAWSKVTYQAVGAEVRMALQAASALGTEP